MILGYRYVKYMGQSLQDINKRKNYDLQLYKNKVYYQYQSE